ncbi:DNA repair protein RecN [Vicingaceae bacterium]|nr:DNA repair protein RecN [Vicingaceae bacterium]
MLKSLKISNYALIEELYVELDQSFTIITGETGAGKSILLGALGLIIGQRADLSALKDQSKKCIIEAQFNIEKYDLHLLFKQNDWDYDRHTIVRREITPNGKSRAFINDSPVNLSQLKELGDQLIDIHSQHNTLTLNNNLFQLKLIDSLADNKSLLSDYKLAYSTYKSFKKKLYQKEESIVKAKAEENFLQFQFDELDQLKLSIDEDEELEEEQSSLEHMEETKASMNHALNVLVYQDENATDLMRLGKSQLSDASKFNKIVEELNERLSSLLIEFQDITNEIESENNNLEYDPDRLEFIRNRLSSIYSLQKKHGVSTNQELIDIKSSIESKLVEISNFDNDIEELKLEVSKIELLLNNYASDLTARRNSAAPILESKVKELLIRLGMKNASLTVKVISNQEFSSSGKEDIQFLFTANKGLEERELSKVASGGELSRLMLAIKSILARKVKMPTIIFDEIDTGVSGEIADKVGDILKLISKELQVVSITHLPQMAAKGNSHLKVYKEDIDGETRSFIKVLNNEERIEELAKMLSGSKMSVAAIDNAKALLNQ